MTGLVYGGVSVPYTVSWTGEAATRIDACPHARQRAVCQGVAPGEGKPRFGTPPISARAPTAASLLILLAGIEGASQ